MIINSFIPLSFNIGIIVFFTGYIIWRVLRAEKKKKPTFPSDDGDITEIKL